MAEKETINQVQPQQDIEDRESLAVVILLKFLMQRNTVALENMNAYNKSVTSFRHSATLRCAQGPREPGDVVLIQTCNIYLSQQTDALITLHALEQTLCWISMTSGTRGRVRTRSLRISSLGEGASPAAQEEDCALVHCASLRWVKGSPSWSSGLMHMLWNKPAAESQWRAAQEEECALVHCASVRWVKGPPHGLVV